MDDDSTKVLLKQQQQPGQLNRIQPMEIEAGVGDLEGGVSIKRWSDCN
jgi:hypothetical protein